MKKRLIILVVFALSTYATIQIMNAPLPVGESGAKADALANNMMQALNKAAFDSAETISWSYARGNHHYVWKKKVDSVSVRWEDFHVELNTKTLLGVAEENNKSLVGEELNNVLNVAWEFFANDSFWLVAPYKIYDPGTHLQAINTENGFGLLVTYKSGGVTPGDSYLWLLDDNYFPTGWKMWTQKVPVQGVEFKWEEWNQYQGVWIAQKHSWLISVDITNISVK